MQSRARTRHRNPTAAELTHLKDALDYNADTGVFTWKIKRRGSRGIGSVAGSPHGSGYVSISYQRKPYLAHRLAVAFATGEWPDGQVDHANGVRADNRISNLRVTDSITLHRANSSGNARNQTGFKGVGVHKATGRYQARIGFEGKSLFLGLFDTPQEAAAAYAGAAVALFGSFACNELKRRPVRP